MVQSAICTVTLINETKVAAVRNAMPPEEDLFRLAETFRMLGDPTRVRILHALSLEELCVCDIASLLGTTKSAVSTNCDYFAPCEWSNTGRPAGLSTIRWMTTMLEICSVRVSAILGHKEFRHDPKYQRCLRRWCRGRLCR
jgi:DNA-binding transcriptional ArsR family regulator